MTKDTHDWLARATALAPLIEAAGGRTEMERKIPADVLSAMHAARLFHILLPVSLGGGGVDLVTFNEVVETLAAADASPAWCLAQAAVTSHAAGFLEPKIAREVFGASDALVAWGPPAGIAKALAVNGGYRVTGKWRFASGSANATWMGGHSTVFEASDKPRRDAGGNPINRTMLFRRERAHIGDTWHVLGLRGTASHDYEVTDLFVPEEYTTWRDSAADRRESGPLYNIPMLTLYGVGFSGVALGIAGSSLAAFMQLAQTKRSGGGLGSANLLRDNTVIQSGLARASGQLRSARAFLVQMLREVWVSSATSGALSLEQRAHLRVAITGAMEAARKVVNFAYRAAGTTAIFEGSAFERRFRDLHTLLAQGQAHLSNFESAGQALFGLEPRQRL
ncbi:MAG: acyl-CoA dehydrogenase [Alphaproteobacteria bacterium]|nr:MAG: acyl-CoA dehydrogenase [Alphaproteobacteria bacterium]